MQPQVVGGLLFLGGATGGGRRGWLSCASHLFFQPHVSRALALIAGAQTDANGLQYLQKRLGLDESELAAMQRKLMFCPGEDGIRSTLDAVQGHLGLSPDALCTMVCRFPAIIGLSFEGNIKPTLDAVQGHLGLSPDALRKMVCSLPAIIGYSFEGNIKPTLDAVQGHLGLSDDALLWYIKPPTGNDPYHQNHLLDSDAALNS
jgi:hypothetical protein